jgi:hypothetical protein
MHFESVKSKVNDRILERMQTAKHYLPAIETEWPPLPVMDLTTDIMLERDVGFRGTSEAAGVFQDRAFRIRRKTDWVGRR